jgi:hypothetical protein
MNTQPILTVKTVRSGKPAEKWVVDEIEGGFMVRCGDAVLRTVNGHGKPRVFRSLDTVIKKLREEIGVTEFEVIARKMDA